MGIHMTIGYKIRLRALEMSKEGQTNKEIAASLGISRNTVTRIVREGRENKPVSSPASMVEQTKGHLDEAYGQLENYISYLERIGGDPRYGTQVRAIAEKHGLYFANASEQATAISLLSRFRARCALQLDQQTQENILVCSTNICDYIEKGNRFGIDTGNSGPAVKRFVSKLLQITYEATSGRHSVESLAQAALTLEDALKLGVDVTTLMLASKLVKKCLQQGFDILGYFGNSNVGEKMAKLRSLDELIAERERHVDEIESRIFQRGMKLFELGVKVSEAGSLPQIRQLKNGLASEVTELQRKIMELKGSLEEIESGIITIVRDILMPHLQERYFAGGQNAGDYHWSDPMMNYYAYLTIELLVDLVVSYPEYYTSQLRKYAPASPLPQAPKLTGSNIIRLRPVDQSSRGIIECKGPHHQPSY